ncbi:MAG: hypothetical protein ACLRZ9_01360 [Eubacterium sp.]
MKNKISKKVTAVMMAGILTAGSCVMSISAASSCSIGKVELLNGNTKATATTIISTASNPVDGMVGTATVTTYNNKGTKKSASRTDGSRKISVSRTAATNRYFVRAEGLHIQYYRGSEILRKSTSVKN